MSVNWTKEQLDAIEAKNRAIVVSAAAGSGKTAVLVEKLLRILSDRENPVPADRIAVVTFTNDAAAQMKQRLTAALAAAAELEPENEWLTAQQALIPSAKISTIHSFCFSLIRENAGSLDVDSSFRVLDPAEDDVIAAKAAENVFDDWFENRHDDMKRLTDFFCPGAKDQRKLAAIIPELRDNILALPFPTEYMEQAAKRYKEPPEPENDSLIKLYADYVTKKLKNAAALEEEAYEDAINEYGSDFGGVSKIQKNMDIFSAEVSNVMNAADRISDDPSQLFSGKFSCKFDKVTFYSSGTAKDADGSKTDIQFDKSVIESVKDKRNACKAAFEKFGGEFTYEDIRSDYIVHGEICEKLFGLMNDVFAEERRLKNEKNALGFSDAEQIACSLLCSRLPDGTVEKSPLAKELSDYFSIVMIDEFQDSTAVQELIFRMISKNGTADIPGRNFFAVGDVKQSIYRFRCADPRIFMKNIDLSVPYSEEGSEPAYILLNRNFRSSHHVVEFVNAVFRVIMSKQNGGIDYGDDESLIEGASCEDDFGPTEIIRLPAADSSDEDDSGDSTNIDLIEARCVASKISDLLKHGTVHDKNGERPVRPSDICILTRNANTAPLFTSCLEELGINASGAAEESYLEAREISVLINLLRCIDNPTLDIPMAAVLMSPMFMFSAEDMANIRSLRGSSVFGDITAASSGKGSFSASLRKQCGEFLTVFGTLREYAASHSVEELIGFIYDKTDFMSVISIYKDSLKKKANLRLLPVYAADYDKNGTGGLSGFVRRINNMLDSSKDFAAASAAVSSEEAVSIKTIHKSKGLEYPFIFLCRSWTRFNLMDMNRRMVFVSDYGTAFKISDPSRLTAYESFPRRALSLIMEKNQRDEEMMLLYVALTRAKNKLFITRRTDEKAQKHRESIFGLLDSRKMRQEEAVSAGVSMADWLDAALGLFKKHDDVYSLGSCDAVFSQAVLTDEMASEESTKEQAEYSPQRAELFNRLISREYDLTLANTASKITVSEIAEKHIIPPRAVFSKDRGRPKGISAAAAGTAVHAFMQYADLKKLYTERSAPDAAIADEAARLCSLGLLTKVQAECADSSMISTFLNSELCGRMMNADEIYREKKFLVRISDLNLDDSDLMVYNSTEGMLQGVADCVFRENGKYVLLDYKTDRRVTEDMLRERYSRQLSLYARALSMIFGKKISEGCIYSFSLGKTIGIEFNKKD